MLLPRERASDTEAIIVGVQDGSKGGGRCQRERERVCVCVRERARER